MALLDAQLRLEAPVAVYTAEGKSYIVICDVVGKICLLEGATGQLLSSLDTRA